MVESQTDHADVKIHPPILMSIHLAVAILLGTFMPLPVSVPNALLRGGLIFAFVGFLFGVAAFWEFIKTRTTLDPHGSVKRLVTSGIYRFSRNPIYLGFVMTLIGVSLALDSYWGVALAPILVILFNRLVIRHEEAYLEKKFGEGYAGYRSRVRRWL